MAQRWRGSALRCRDDEVRPRLTAQQQLQLAILILFEAILIPIEAILIVSEAILILSEAILIPIEAILIAGTPRIDSLMTLEDNPLR
jgi:hypothetical protein